MKLFISFCRLIRWTNLFFIILAQCLFQFCIYNPIYQIHTNETPSSFYLILLASLFIAAAGYAINDYFDVNIDQVNKPNKVVVSNIISRRWVIFWHFFFSLLGIYLTLIALPFHPYWHIHLANLLAILFLWFYSTTLKKKLLVGNILIAVLTAWVIAVVYFSKFSFAELIQPNVKTAITFRFFKLMILYSAFAFVLTIIREALKDIEDMEGDQKFGCRTIPIAWGLKPAKVYLAVWLVVVIAVLAVIQIYVIPFGWWLSIAFCVVFIISPLIWVLYQLPKAFTHQDFNALSNAVKLAMLAGVLSMLFFYFLK
ncbi:MAG: geranylgeranylglycerol-phosphate geranylgeranyltransferase [Chitinophagia bacterium]